jgi:hypothetical protein
VPRVDELGSGRFRVRWLNPSTGKWDHTPDLTFPTKSAARAYGRDQEAKIRRGDYRDPRSGQVLLRDWIVQWQESRIGEDRTLGEERRRSTATSSRASAGRRPLGDLKLDAIDEMVVQAWVKRLEVPGWRRRRSALLPVLSAVLRPAIRTRRIPVDPLREIKLPTLPPPDDFYWERDEIDAIAASGPSRSTRRCSSS